MLDRYARLDAFLARVREDIYPEAPMASHTDITAAMFEKVRGLYALPSGARVVDVGCGQGVALERFRQAGFDATGITLGEDAEVCRSKGLKVVETDMTFLDFEDDSFDLVWARHALEHSIMPYFMLAEIHRVLAPGGVVYVEVPAPDTAAGHQKNPNHYSVLPKSMWSELMLRVGFPQVRHWEIPTALIANGAPDPYWAFSAQKAG